MIKAGKSELEMVNGGSQERSPDSFHCKDSCFSHSLFTIHHLLLPEGAIP